MSVRSLKVPPPEELYLLVHAETGEVGDAVLLGLTEKYRAPGFVPVRYAIVRPRRRFARAVERNNAGRVERRCNGCMAWSPRERMRPAKGCSYGVSNECRLCYRERKSLTRAAARLTEDHK